MLKVQSLTKEFQSHLSKLNKELKDKTIVSLAFDIHKIRYELNPILKRNNFCFYYERPSKKYSIFASGEVLSLIDKGNKRFIKLDKKFNELKSSIKNNWAKFRGIKFPLFMGGMKFHPDSASDEWIDFPSSKWVIPQFVLLKNSGRVFLIYNFIFNSSEDHVKIFTNNVNEFIDHIYTSGSKKSFDNFQLLQKLNERIEWQEKVNKALKQIKNKKIKKIVLSREVVFCAAEELDFDSSLQILKNKFPECTLFIYKSGNSYFIGATPENLALFSNKKLYVDALAGSAPRGMDKVKDLKLQHELLNSSKNLEEHKLVSSFILKVLKKHAGKISILKERDIKKLSNIQHIWTEVLVELKKDYSIFKILDDVYPTPAVCGIPKKEVYGLIQGMEGYDRGLYSGILGWFNHNDDGEFVIAIRSALYLKNKLFAFAGCGIVEDSDPEEEFKETELKLKPILSILYKNED